MFSAIVEVQRQSQDLVVYSRLAGSIVRVAWPEKKGIPIVPKGLKRFLDGKGVFWECFCGILSPEARSCRIVASKDRGDVFAFCHGIDGDPKCGFFMNLTARVKTTQLYSDYGHLPSARTGRRANMTPYIFSHKHTTSLQETAPFFQGYLGEFSYEHAGATQLNSGIRFNPEDIRPRVKNATRYVITIEDAADIEFNTAPSNRRGSLKEQRKNLGTALQQFDKTDIDLWAYGGTEGPSVSEGVPVGEELLQDVFPRRTGLDQEPSVEVLHNDSEEGLSKSEFESLMEPWSKNILDGLVIGILSSIYDSCSVGLRWYVIAHRTYGRQAMP
ncbi:hypothetical protein CVT26_010481 [Gymnopilus dilepis]|uniref:Uncharacterized protein n=1 Tax=Gymnopilus dilepis TaxID=231916 RepID=A0A409Y0G7_9AGAR|nr:hypothetical protein CVT26_010481 [Gymnopilus dilepis]